MSILTTNIQSGKLDSTLPIMLRKAEKLGRVDMVDLIKARQHTIYVTHKARVAAVKKECEDLGVPYMTSLDIARDCVRKLEQLRR